MVVIGIILSVSLVILGFITTNYTEDGVLLVLFSSSIPCLGIYFYIYKWKYIGLGMLLATIPILLLGLLFIVASNLH